MGENILLAESLDFSSEDVGRCLEPLYIPVHKDGIKESAKHVLSIVLLLLRSSLKWKYQHYY